MDKSVFPSQTGLFTWYQVTDSEWDRKLGWHRRGTRTRKLYLGATYSLQNSKCGCVPCDLARPQGSEFSFGPSTPLHGPSGSRSALADLLLQPSNAFIQPQQPVALYPDIRPIVVVRFHRLNSCPIQ